MSQREFNPTLYRKNGGEISLSGSALTDLLRVTLARGASFRFCARGFSMSPFVKDGDIVTILPFKSDLPAIGQIAAVVREETQSLIVHRVIGIDGDTVFLKGDNDPLTRDVVQVADILGFVKMIERNGRKVYLGLGPERILIAALARCGLLSRILNTLRRMKHSG